MLLTFADLHREISSTLPTIVGVRGYEDADDVTPIRRSRATTRERRAHTVNLLPQMGPDYKFIEKYKIVSVSGELFVWVWSSLDLWVWSSVGDLFAATNFMLC